MYQNPIKMDAISQNVNKMDSMSHKNRTGETPRHTQYDGPPCHRKPAKMIYHGTKHHQSRTSHVQTFIMGDTVANNSMKAKAFHRTQLLRVCFRVQAAAVAYVGLSRSTHVLCMSCNLCRNCRLWRTMDFCCVWFLSCCCNLLL